jgi:hypothetical protein
VNEPNNANRTPGFIDLGHILMPVWPEFGDWYAGRMTGTAMLELAKLLYGRQYRATIRKVLECDRELIAYFERRGTTVPPPLAIAILRVCCQIRLLDYIAALNNTDQWNECLDYHHVLQRAFAQQIPFIADKEHVAQYSLWGDRLTHRVIARARRQRCKFEPFEEIFGSLARPK